MTSYAQNLEAFLADTLHAHKTLAKFGISDPIAAKAEEDSGKFLVLTQQRLLHTATADEISAHFAAGTQAIDAVYALQASAGERIDENLGARIQSAKQSFWFASVASVFGIGLMLYFMLAFHTSFLWDLGQVLAFMHETATGNLRHRVDILGKDEISDMNSAMTLMVRNMSAMVADVRSNAALVRHAGDTLVNGNTALATRTEQQAANLEQTSATVNEVASALQTTSLAAQNSDYTAGKVRDAAEHGAQGMLQAVATIEAIAKSTTRMDEIVGVIDGLAFQTNILALNAAVEAARAGDSGRGFAVVASEVRSLAQRSAAASREIRNLIGASSTQIDLGVREIQSAEGSISKIVEGIREVAQMISGITASSVEQSNSLAEITAAVRQLDLITQQNATMVDESVNQAKALLARAVHLEQAADSYKLQQGTAEEARWMVEEALALLKTTHSVSEFLGQLNHSQGHFHDRDMYVFVLDGQGKYLAYAGNISKVGTSVHDIAGIDGQNLIESIVRQASSCPGWVEYDITNPVSGKIQTKMSYVHGIDSIYVGCGVYKALV